MQDRYMLLILLLIITASATGLVLAYGGSNPPVMGHTWGEMICDSNLCVSTGRVGIGTTNPASSLDVNGKGAFVSPNFGTTGGVAIRDAAGNPNAAYLQFVNNDYTAQYGFVQGLASGGLNLGGGNVGIGTASPNEKLRVSGGNIGLDPGNWLRWPSGAADTGVDFGYGTSIRRSAQDGRMQLNSQNGNFEFTGNVGIGTTAPIRALHVNGELLITRSDGIAFIDVSDPAGNGGGTIWLRGLTNGGVAGTDATVLITGKLGIGTESPSAPLTVAGDIVATGQIDAAGGIKRHEASCFWTALATDGNHVCPDGYYVAGVCFTNKQGGCNPAPIGGGSEFVSAGGVYCCK